MALMPLWNMELPGARSVISPTYGSCFIARNITSTLKQMGQPADTPPSRRTVDQLLGLLKKCVLLFDGESREAGMSFDILCVIPNILPH